MRLYVKEQDYYAILGSDTEIPSKKLSAYLHSSQHDIDATEFMSSDKTRILCGKTIRFSLNATNSPVSIPIHFPDGFFDEATDLHSIVVNATPRYALQRLASCRHRTTSIIESPVQSIKRTICFSTTSR